MHCFLNVITNWYSSAHINIDLGLPILIFSLSSIHADRSKWTEFNTLHFNHRMRCAFNNCGCLNRSTTRQRATSNWSDANQTSLCVSSAQIHFTTKKRSYQTKYTLARARGIPDHMWILIAKMNTELILPRHG